MGPTTEEDEVRPAVPDSVFEEISKLRPEDGKPTKKQIVHRDKHLAGLVVASAHGMKCKSLHFGNVGEPWIRMWKVIAASQGLTLRAWVLKTLAAQVEVGKGIPRVKQQEMDNENEVDAGPPKMELGEAMKRLFPAELAQRLQQNLSK